MIQQAKTIGWSAWHPRHGFEIPFHQGGNFFADIDDAVRLVRSLNREDRTNNRTGWRAVPAQLARVIA